MRGLSLRRRVGCGAAGWSGRFAWPQNLAASGAGISVITHCSYGSLLASFWGGAPMYWSREWSTSDGWLARMPQAEQPTIREGGSGAVPGTLALPPPSTPPRHGG